MFTAFGARASARTAVPGGLAPREVLGRMEAAWNKTESYSCRMHVWSKRGKAEKTQAFEYRFMKPRLVRLKVLGGSHNGATVLYRDGKVKASERVLGIRVRKGLSLKDPLLHNLRGVPFWEADAGSQVALVRQLLPGSRASVSRGPKAVTLTLKWHGRDPRLDEGAHDYAIAWRLDPETWFPLERTTTEDGVPVEVVKITELDAHAGLADDAFRL